MPSLDDLKKNAIDPTAMNTEPVVNIGQPTKDEGFVPTVEMGDPIPKPLNMSMMTGKSVAPRPNSGERVKADLSSLPKPKPTGKVALDPRTEVLDDVFGEGGQFEKYKAMKQKEMIEYFEQQAQKEEAEREEAEVERAIENTETVPMSMEEEIESDYRAEEKKVVPIDLMDGMDEVMHGIEEDKISETRNLVPVELTKEHEVKSLDEIPVAEEPVKVVEETKDVEEDIHLDDDFELDITTVEESDEVMISESDDDSVSSTEDDISEEDRLNYLKSLISAKIHPVAKKLDLSTFTVAKKVVTSNNVMSTKDTIAATWPLPYSGTVIMMKSWTGAELESLRSAMEDQEPNHRMVLNMIYNHITSPKPNFEQWLKTTYFFDYNHIFMAIYAASFNGANFIPVDCANDKCTNKIKTYLTDNIPIMNMVHFNDEKAKERFMKLYKSETYQANVKTVEIVPITEELAIGFKIPTLYSVLIEPQYFNEQFVQKYTQTINLLPYIDNLYQINMETKELFPIGYKIYQNNLRKTILGRTVRYDRILSQLNPDEYNIVGGFTNSINDTMNDKIGWDYRYPETTCPDCGHINPESAPQNPALMVFTRNRLGLLASI